MPYNKAYRVLFPNVEEQIVVCMIYDTASGYIPDIANTQITDLQGAGNPLTLSVIDNDEDRFSTIKALQLEINFHSTNQANMSSFAEGDDNRWFVDCWIQGLTENNYLFRGFVVLDDLTTDFLPDEANTVTLTATDGIGLLKDIPLTNFEGNNPKGKFRIADYLQWALSKTGLTLAMYVVNNIRFAVSPYSLFHAWEKISLDAKTFEAEIGTSLDCYTVLEWILKSAGCFLTQYKGEWWIMRVDEMDGRTQYVTRYEAGESTTYLVHEPDGVPFIARNIGLEGAETDAWFSNEATVVTYERPYKELLQSYNYDYPKELIDNIDFSRSKTPSGPAEPADYGDLEGVDIADIGYNAAEWYKLPHVLEDWTIGRGIPTPAAITTTAAAKAVYHAHVQYDRYAEIKGDATGSNYIVSNPLHINYRDKFTFSVDRKLSENVSGGTTTDNVASIKLVPDTGAAYWLQATGEWATSPIGVFQYQWNSNDEQETDWKTVVNVEAKAVPVSGKLYIYLHQSSIHYNKDTRFKNLKFEYIPYVNSSYKEFDGQYTRVWQDTNYKNTRETELNISTAPSQLFKGALLYEGETSYKNIGEGSLWFDFSRHPDGIFDDTEKHSYGFFQAQSEWRQFNRLMRKFEVDVQGCYGESFFSCVHYFRFTDTSPHTKNKIFLLLHYEVDLYECSWTGVFAETHDEGIVKTDTANIELKYLEKR